MIKIITTIMIAIVIFFIIIINNNNIYYYFGLVPAEAGTDDGRVQPRPRRDTGPR